jgi:hypothetical protein
MQRPTVNLSQCQRPQRCGRVGGPRPSLGRLRNPALRAASASTPIHRDPCRANEPPALFGGLDLPRPGTRHHDGQSQDRVIRRSDVVRTCRKSLKNCGNGAAHAGSA